MTAAMLFGWQVVIPMTLKMTPIEGRMTLIGPRK